MALIKIRGVSYTIIDTKEKITMADSFVKPSNKIGTGNGEGKLYIGNENAETRSFFGRKGFVIKCFLLKKDLIQYLKDSETEYKNPEQLYRRRNEMAGLWKERMKKVSEMDEILWFDLKEQTQIQGTRKYVNSSSEYFTLIRELSLPNMTYLSMMKLRTSAGKIVYYTRLFVDYFGESVHPHAVKEEIEKIKQIPVKKEQIISARVGQGKYREGLLKESPVCPVTLISDDRLLIASHIKPWVKSDDKEKIDPKNGLLLTPTFDLLFDRGFITFTDDKKMHISPWLSKMTCSKLRIAPGKIYPMLPVDGRQRYLKYHRENVFKN